MAAAMSCLQSHSKVFPEKKAQDTTCLKGEWHLQPEYYIPSHIKNALPARGFIHWRIFQAAEVLLVSYISKVLPQQVNRKCRLTLMHKRSADARMQQRIRARWSFGTIGRKGPVLPESMIELEVNGEVAPALSFRQEFASQLRNPAGCRNKRQVTYAFHGFTK